MKSWEEWTSELALAVASVSDADLARAAEVCLRADVVLTAGNGGSSALASHAAQAISKPDYTPGGGRPAVCLTDGVPGWSAHANDGGWPDALVECARPYFESRCRCAILVISSSGRSENVVRLARLAVERGAPVIALTGFDGEPLRSIARDSGGVALHVDSHDYEVVEPAHDALLHRVQYHLRRLVGDRRSEILRLVVERWPVPDGAVVRAEELVDLAESSPGWRRALLEWCPARAGAVLPTPSQVGCALREIRDQVVGGCVVEAVKKGKDGTAWVRRVVTAA